MGRIHDDFRSPDASIHERSGSSSRSRRINSNRQTLAVHDEQFIPDSSLEQSRTDAITDHSNGAPLANPTGAIVNPNCSSSAATTDDDHVHTTARRISLANAFSS